MGDIGIMAKDADLTLTWKQTNQNTYERALDDFEKFFAFIAVVGQGRPDKQNWYTTTAVKVDTKRGDFVDDVRQAWTYLRYVFPTYSAVIEDGHWVYRVAANAELASWLEETFYVHDCKKTARQLFPLESNPSRRAVLHVLPRTQELVLQAPHTHVDGIGMVTFFHHMMRILVEPAPKAPDWGSEGANLLPPLAISAQVKPYTPSQKQMWDSYLQNFFGQFPTMRVQNENKGARATRSKVQWLTFTEEETNRIAASSKALGFSVTAAAQAAMSLTARIHGQVDNTTHSTFAIYNARDYVDPTTHPHENLVGPHVFSMPAVFPVVPDSFVETAKMARQVFMDYKKDDMLRAVSPFWATDIPAALSTPPPSDFPVAADLQLSSVGILDRYLDSRYSHEGQNGRPEIEVQDVWIALDMLYPNVAVEMWTFRGRLVIELNYNETYHREESIMHLLTLIHEQLSQGLQLNLGFDARCPGEESFLDRVSETSMTDGVCGEISGSGRTDDKSILLVEVDEVVSMIV